MKPTKTRVSAKARPPLAQTITVNRVQTGVRLEQRLLKVLKALAEYLDMTLGDLLEGIVLHAFDAKAPFQESTLRRIAQLKDVYGLDLDSGASHRLVERDEEPHR
jgi:predicted DNA-binding ribbon-helix-helix protein